MKLEKFNYSSGKRSRWFLYGVICTVALMVLINIFFSKAMYFNTESIKIAEGNISYKPYDFKIMAMYEEKENGEYQEIEIMPTSGYIINEEKSYCTLDNINKDSNVLLRTIDGNHTFNNLSKNEKCYLYFDIYSIKEEILATKTISTRTDFSTILTTDTTGTVYSAEDDYGISYYYAGAPTDNWVKFAGFYWRIIRINGDGTIRMIYQGTVANTTGTGTQIGTSAFNTNYNDNMYVGYMYTSGQVHGTGTASTIKGVLDSWYDSNLTSYANYIDTNAGFCGDRTGTTINDGAPNDTGGTGTTSTYYGARYRLVINKTPSLKCPYSSDLYTLTSSSKGNKALTKPIGLITADEVAYTGGVNGTSNSIYYLYTEQNYWTMSPWAFDGNYNDAAVVTVHTNGHPVGRDADYAFGVRPVINLRTDTKFVEGGTGTVENPYIVQ